MTRSYPAPGQMQLVDQKSPWTAILVLATGHNAWHGHLHSLRPASRRNRRGFRPTAAPARCEQPEWCSSAHDMERASRSNSSAHAFRMAGVYDGAGNVGRGWKDGG